MRGFMVTASASRIDPEGHPAMIHAATATDVLPLFLPSTGSAAKSARDFVVECCALWAVKDDFAARILVSELVTNAHRHSPGEWLIVRVSLDDPGHLLIEVWDACPREPEILTPTEEQENGRGMGLIGHVADKWGIVMVDETQGGGKVVWARVAVRR
ncbi:ATP-binding protein [Actinomadura sp. 6N118]|uniref:ATP-binding protein n=1 Tax=Actinomadura sp. 6N118 TaxID=3375151 RepID=UPI00379146AF